jgi:predicted amidophosphoribosyltransferase
MELRQPLRQSFTCRLIVDGVRRCLACGATVSEPDALCRQCWSSMTFFAPPYCSIYALTVHQEARLRFLNDP